MIFLSDFTSFFVMATSIFLFNYYEYCICVFMLSYSWVRKSLRKPHYMQLEQHQDKGRGSTSVNPGSSPPSPTIYNNFNRQSRYNEIGVQGRPLYSAIFQRTGREQENQYQRGHSNFVENGTIYIPNLVP